MLEVDNEPYLITNRHVIFDAQQEQDKQPYLLKTSVHMKSPPPSQDHHKKITVSLYNDDDSPKWIEHPTHQKKQPSIDIVALPIQKNLESILFVRRLFKAASNIDFPEKKIDYPTMASAIPISAIDTDVEYLPPDMVHVIGYPLGWQPNGKDKASSAFWRTCFIASEIYGLSTQRADRFFVDPSPLEGMTGSPVLGLKGDQIKLLGVYSDLSTAEFGASAGVVYRASFVKELFK